MDLLERDRELEELQSTLHQAVTGRGSVVVISGEAGIGKTELVREFVRSSCDGMQVLWGGCDDLSTPRTLGPLRDIAAQVGGALRDALVTGAPRGEVLDATFSILDGGRPATVAVIEDVHWADDATLDVLKFLGRRIERMPAVLVISYRAEEVEADHPVRLMVGDLPVAAVRRLEMAPLSRSAVAALARDEPENAAALYEATGGNPLLVSEVLLEPGLAPTAAVKDAVLARASRLSAPARELAELVSVVPTQVERSVLERIDPSFQHNLEECRRRGLVEYDESWVWYRHELVRAAIEASLGEVRRRHVNAVIVGELIADGADVARIVHHARRAADHTTLAQFAPAAARQASAAESHREALAHYRIAVEHMEAMHDVDRATLLTEYAVESYVCSEVAAALEISDEALEMWRALDAPEQEGAMLRWQSRFHWWLGHAEAAETTGEEAVTILESVEDSPALPMAYSNLAQLAMLAQDYEAAVRWSSKAIEASEARKDQATLSHALNNLGSARVRVGDATGFDLLEQSLEIALEHRLDDHAGRAYANIIWTALDYRQYELAERRLAEGMAYAVQRGLGGSLDYMTSERAMLRFDRGEWQAADEDVQWVLSRPEEAGITHMPALAIRARLAVRRGDPEARKVIDEAWALAEPTGELQRMGPIAAAKAELAWLEGDLEACRVAVEPSFRTAVSVGQPWVSDELAFWMWRSGDVSVQASELVSPFGLQIRGRWREAADAWDDIGCPYEQAMALFDGDDPEQLRRGLQILDDLGATPASRMMRSKLRSLGVHHIPRGPRRATRENPAGLTSRQLDVLTLLVTGNTNAEIAEALFISPKTVDHHVSAVLSKLEVPTRQEAARVAVERGFVDPP